MATTKYHVTIPRLSFAKILKKILFYLPFSFYLKICIENDKIYTTKNSKILKLPQLNKQKSSQ